ncbi:hypothetical protein [Kitasatospora sp. NPDC088346]|uniref:hypothetical protein n=1 Tax=Kitasatospora sp. NPDC088346 TaxID=3364073 RepID=UPI003824D4C8
MTDHEVGVPAIGAGPANLPLAAVVDGSGNTGLADGTLLLGVPAQRSHDLTTDRLTRRTTPDRVAR